MEKGKSNVRKLTTLALLSAILVIMAFTPLGSLPLGGPIVATLSCIPVVVGAVMLGAKPGAFLGFVFGFVSMLYFTIYASPVSFLFSPVHAFALGGGNAALGLWYALASIILCFGSRIMIGVVAGLVYKRLHAKNNTAAVIVAGALGSITNTFFVLSFNLLFFAQPYANAIGRPVSALWALVGTTIVVNAIPEAIVTPLVSLLICKALFAARKRA